MKIAKHGTRSIIRIAYDGRVHKTFQGKDKDKRFENEIMVLRELEARGCDYVPRVLEKKTDTLTVVTTNCGSPAGKLPGKKVREIFDDLRDDFGIIHKDPSSRNLTYNGHREKFCVIDFESAEVLGSPVIQHKVTSLVWSGMSKSGKTKEKNEDSLGVFSAKFGWADIEDLKGTGSTEASDRAFIVSDGMGGHAAGEVASKLVIHQLQRIIPSMIGDSTCGLGSPSTLLHKAIMTMHSQVLLTGESNPELSNMGATVVCVLFSRGDLHFGHVGDSRLYRFRGGRLKQLSDDHSFVGQLQLKGKITEKQARLNPRRNVLTQAIGAQCEFIEPQIGSSRIEKDDWYLICSDGVIDGLWDKQIEQEFLMAVLAKNTPEIVASKLLNRAYEEAGRDDTTLFVIKAE